MYLFDKVIIISFIVFAFFFLAFWILAFSAKLSGEIRTSEDVMQLFDNRIIKTIVLVTLFSGIIGFGGAITFTEFLENQLKKELQSFNEKTDKLIINDKLSGNSKKVINNLISYHSIRANHSVPTKSLRIKAILNNKEINLLLSRDSIDSTIYWVFVPEYSFSRDNPVWKVKTDLFNKYK